MCPVIFLYDVKIGMKIFVRNDQCQQSIIIMEQCAVELRIIGWMAVNKRRTFVFTTPHCTDRRAVSLTSTSYPNQRKVVHQPLAESVLGFYLRLQSSYHYATMQWVQ